MAIKSITPVTNRDSPTRVRNVFECDEATRRVGIVGISNKLQHALIRIGAELLSKPGENLRSESQLLKIDGALVRRHNYASIDSARHAESLALPASSTSGGQGVYGSFEE
jgi:hypothetical protein